jgi:arabinofuranosyltransferase
MTRNGTKQIDALLKGHLVQIMALVYALLLALIVVFLNRSFYHDDAYITLRYARNHAAGLGIVWNPGEYIQGYTSILHLILISFLGKLGIEMVWASRLVGLIAYAGLVTVVACFVTPLKSEYRASLWHLPVILVATSAPILVWTLGGLEGLLFSLLVAGGALLFLAATTSLSTYWLYAASGVCFGLSFLTRPDGIVFIAVSCGYLLWLALRHKARVSHLIAFLAAAVFVALPYLMWQMHRYGGIVPNTFYAKVGTPLWLRLRAGGTYALTYAVHPPFLLLLVIVCLVFAFLKRSWNSAVTYLVLSVGAYITFVVIIAGGDHMQSFRLMLPIIPLMSMTLALVLPSVIGLTRSMTINRITVSILILSSFQVLDCELIPRRDDAAFVGTIVGKYIADAWPAGSLVALNTAGSTPYYAGAHRYIDMLGLNDATIARRKIERIELVWQRVPGHLKGDGNYVLSRHPDFIIMGPAEGTVASNPWFLSDLELSKDERFLRDYAPRRVTLAEDGRPSAGGPVTFTYYQRVETRKEADSVQQPVPVDRSQ